MTSHLHQYKLMFTPSNGGFTQTARRGSARVVYPNLDIMPGLNNRYWQYTLPVEEGSGWAGCSVFRGGQARDRRMVKVLYTGRPLGVERVWGIPAQVSRGVIIVAILIISVAQEAERVGLLFVWSERRGRTDEDSISGQHVRGRARVGYSNLDIILLRAPR